MGQLDSWSKFHTFQMHTSIAVSRFFNSSREYPMVKLYLESFSHPSGADASGAIPSSTACAKVVAAKDRAARMVDVRMVKASRGVRG